MISLRTELAGLEPRFELWTLSKFGGGIELWTVPLNGLKLKGMIRGRFMDAMGTKVGGGLFEEVSIENGEPLLLQEKSLLMTVL